MQFKVVIPARYASTRLPGKPLLDIAGLPMVVRVAQQAKKSGAHQVVIATDYEGIDRVAKAYDIQSVMTRIDHLSGTDRIAEVAQKMGWVDDDIIVNVQGDEPLIAPSLIQQVAMHLVNNPQAVMSTACHSIDDETTFLNPNVVKVVLDAQSNALYFSRSPIPYPRDNAHKQNIQAHRHIGIYAYRVDFLRKYTSLDITQLEDVESLEQLRVLFYGYKIAVTICKDIPVGGVDTQEDLDNVRKMMSAKN